MVTKDNSPGLFARVASFVRSPVAAGADERFTPSQNTESSAQTIKRVLARKTHNDAVRKREFAQLRKLRQAGSDEAGALIARDSFFLETSGFSVLDEKASTLKKIDEIEAQMSKQWWKNRQQGAAASAEPPAAPQPTVLMSDEDNQSEVETRNSFAATLPTDLSLAGASPVEPARRVDPARVHQFELTGNSAFSNSKIVSIDMGQAATDPVLEDAAVRFANGDDAGAAAALLEAMRAANADADARDAWAAALFDLYRGTGQQDSFDRFALEYAQRFDRSAPVWFSTPQLLGGGHEGAGDAGVPAGLRGPWTCPPVLTAAAVTQLRAALRGGGAPVQLDWRALKSIATDALVPLATVLALCCEQALVLQVQGEAVLGELLRAHTPVGNSRVESVWWKLRLDWLRILGQQPEFELVAMDYCITFEVSPPSWVAARSQRHALPATAVHIEAIELPTGFDSATAVALTGELQGDVSATLRALSAQAPRGADVQVSCEQLIRVDFAAAGSILNWTSNAKAEGRQIEFFQAPRLVGAFFNLVGINEYARILVRAN